MPSGNSSQRKMGKDDIFSIVIIFKLLLSKKAFNRFTTQLNKQINNLSCSLCTISVDTVKQKMGFPPNWFEIRNI